MNQLAQSHPITISEASQNRRGSTEQCITCGARKICPAGPTCSEERLRFDGLLGGRRRVARHSTLFRVGDMLNNLFLVRFGQFKISGANVVGQQRVIGFCMPGDLVGLDGMATGRHQFRATALEDSEVCEISYPRLEAQMTSVPAIQRYWLSVMGKELISDARRSSLIFNMKVDQRFAVFLLDLSAKHSQLGYSPRCFRLSMSRSDIASYLGITVESISRLIGRFKENGWVYIHQREVEILQPGAIEAVARGDIEGACTELATPHGNEP